MNFLRNHWFDIGGALAVIVLIYLGINYYRLTDYQLLMWISLVTLFFHQLEEYRIVGTFPGMINTVVYKSDLPDRYPLNMNTSLFINIYIGWGGYFLAAVLAEKAIWMGFATILVSFGNLIAHTFLFNIKGETVYNAGMATSWFFFAPVTYFFFKIVKTNNLATNSDWIIGIVLGAAINFIGILKMIDWMKDKNTPYIFPERFLLKKYNL